MTTLLAFITAIAVLVVFHELGHYAVARYFNVKILRFSVGFGKVIYSKRFKGGETEWVLSAVPLGGYVKMLDEREAEVAPDELSRTFNRQPPLRRMAIVVAGPVANLLLAIALYGFVFMQGVPGLKPILGEIKPDSPAAIAGLETRSQILSVNTITTPSWQDVRWQLLEAILQGREVNLELMTAQGGIIFRNLDVRKMSPDDLDGELLSKLGLQPYQPHIQPILGKLLEGGVAQQAGLQPQDRILSVNGQPVALWDEVVQYVRAHPQQPLLFEIQRDNTQFTRSLTPELADDNGEKIGRIGAAPYLDRAVYDSLLITVSYPPLQALSEALRKTWETAILSLKMMAKMVVGEVSLKNLSGPITIADYAGQSAQMGWGAYLGFLALISISLGVLNLLPIPLLDGGHLLYYSVELFKGSPVSDKVWQAGQNVGIAILVTMMAFALFNDVSRLISG